jgi:hypothetical protein
MIKAPAKMANAILATPPAIESPGYATQHFADVNLRENLGRNGSQIRRGFDLILTGVGGRSEARIWPKSAGFLRYGGRRKGNPPPRWQMIRENRQRFVEKIMRSQDVFS